VSFDAPSGPPPSEPPHGGPPHDGPVEYLDSRGGDGTPSGPTGGGRRTTVIAVAALVGAAAVGGAAWAAWAFFSTGAQPAEALPDSTLGYVSIDLDPSGGQKIEALRTLKKFPAFDDNVDLGTDDDVSEWIFDKVQGEAGCEDLDYGDDIEPWLGDRFAVAAVDAGEDRPSPIFVVQVSDEDAADAGLKKVRDCGGGTADDGAWAIADGWALIGADQKTVDAVAADAADSTLADDEDFQHWTEAAGDAGIVSMYAAPSAGQALADLFTDSLGGLGGLDVPGVQDQMEEATTELKAFKGAAATVRFDDGGLEIEMAGEVGAKSATLTAGGEGAKAVSTLPDDTAAALGLGLDFKDGWLDELLDPLAQQTGQSADDLLAEANEQLGLNLPEDAETLLGSSLALAVDADFDPESFMSSEGPGDVAGVGVKIFGNADDIDAVLDKLRSAAGGADEGVLDSDSGDGVVALGPDADYRKVLLEDGGLGDTDKFKRVVEHADDATGILYLDFDALDGWIADLTGDDAEARDNLEPLGAFGLSAWQDDDVAHAVIKVTTD
jgi:hypothetical protein